MHSFARRLHGGSSETPPTGSGAPPDASPAKPAKVTKGLVLDLGWRYDLTIWAFDTFLFRGQVRAMRQRALDLARLQPGESLLDVGCGTGTLALAAQRRIGRTGRVVGIDPGAEQIARARAKATRRHLPVTFQSGVIERLPFPDATFDVALSTLMMHHLGDGLKRQGLAEIARVLKPGGRLVIADFAPRKDRQGRAAHFHAGGSSPRDLTAFLQEAGLTAISTEELPPAHLSAFPGASLLTAHKA